MQNISSNQAANTSVGGSASNIGVAPSTNSLGLYELGSDQINMVPYTQQVPLDINGYFDRTIVHGWTQNHKLDDLAREAGYVSTVDGLKTVVLLTEIQNRIVKLWKYGTIDADFQDARIDRFDDLAPSEMEPEEFFVKATVHGALDLDTVIVLSEVSLNETIGKEFYDLDIVRGMSKHFFSIVATTDYLDKWILDDRFTKYWFARRQSLNTHDTKEFKLMTYLLKLVIDKKSKK